MRKVLKVYRAERFSPNSVDRDRAIIDTVGNILADKGFAVTGISEDNLNRNHEADVYLTMARSRHALAILKEKEAEGRQVINRPDSISACRRSTTDRLMRDNGLPAAPLTSENGYWIKRGDEAAQSKDDVIFAANETEKENTIRLFKARGITDIVITANVKGDVVKFYGVRGTGFFKTFYADNDKYSKFGDEQLNGVPQHYSFNIDNMQNDAEQLAVLTGTDVYGGDCIVRADGSYVIIDFNDWPSFARCREEAAKAIALKVK